MTIKVFIPCEPRDPTSMADAAQMIDDLHRHGIRILHGNGMSPTMPAKISEPRWIARRKVPAPPSSPETGAGGTGAVQTPQPDTAPAADAKGGTRNEEDGIFSDRRVPRS